MKSFYPIILGEYLNKKVLDFQHQHKLGIQFRFGLYEISNPYLFIFIPFRDSLGNIFYPIILYIDSNVFDVL